MSDAPTFCPDAGTQRHYARIVELVRSGGYAVGDGDVYLLGSFANAAARFDELAARVAKERNVDRRLRLMRAERAARADLTRLVDALERHYAGVQVEEPKLELQRTGTGGDVLEFRAPGAGSAVGQRIVAVLARSSAPLTRDQLAKRVSGARAAFLADLKALVDAGTIKRSGQGTRSSPHRYWRG